MSAEAKGGAGSASQSYNIFGSFAFLVCAGPVDEVFGIEIDDQLVYTTLLSRSTSPNPVTITIPGRPGTCDFYWGTDDQTTPHPTLQPAGNSRGHDHPAYTGQAYAVFKNFLLGRERTSAPTIRFRVRRRPDQTLITGPAAALVDGQANPFCIFAELFTSERIGRGRTPADFSATHWQAAADAAYARADECYVSVNLDRAVNPLVLFTDIMALCDGFLRVHAGTGLCEAGLYPKPAAINVNALPLIDTPALTAPPSWQPETWEDVITRVTTTYTDRDHNFKERTARYEDPRARLGIGESRSLSLARPFILRAEQARNHAVETGRRRALPGLSGEIAARAARAATLRPGQHIRLDIDPEPGSLRLEQVCRVLRVTRSPTGPTRITVESERTLAPVAYMEPELPPGEIDPDVPDIVHARLFEVPPPLADGAEFSVGVLAERPADMVTDCTPCYDTEDETDSTFPPLGSHRAYALRARLTAAYGAAATTALAIELLGTRDRELIALNPGPVAARNDELLLLAFGPPDTTGGGYRLPLEVFSVVDLVSTGTNTLSVTAYRQRAGTPALAHAALAEVWIIPRDSLPYYSHRDFRAKATAVEPSYFKLQPATYFLQRPIADVAVREFYFDSARVYAPAITVTSPANAPGKTYATVASNGTLTLSGTIADLDANLTSLTIYRSVAGSAEETLFARTFAPSAAYAFELPVLFADDGSHVITIRAQDDTQRIVTRQVNVLAGSLASGTLETPTLVSYHIQPEYDNANNQYESTYRFTILLADIPSGASVVIDYELVWYASPTPPTSSQDNPNGVEVAIVRPNGWTRLWYRARDTNSVYANSAWIYTDLE